MTAASDDSVFRFDQRNKLLEKKVAIPNSPVCRVHVESASALGSDDEKLPDFVLLIEVVKQSPPTAVEESLLVVAEAVQKIKDWIALRGMLRRTRIVARGKVHAIVNLELQDAAIQSIAVDAALSASGK
jgi:hypothetical protein